MFIFSLGFSQILNPNLIESVLDVLVGRYSHFYHVSYNLQEFQSFPVDCIWPLSFQDELTLPHEIAAESTYHPQFWGDSIVVYDIVRVIILVKRYLDKLQTMRQRNIWGPREFHLAHQFATCLVCLACRMKSRRIVFLIDCVLKLDSMIMQSHNYRGHQSW